MTLFPNTITRRFAQLAKRFGNMYYYVPEPIINEYLNSEGPVAAVAAEYTPAEEEPEEMVLTEIIREGFLSIIVE